MNRKRNMFAGVILALAMLVGACDTTPSDPGDTVDPGFGTTTTAPGVVTTTTILPTTTTAP